MISRKNLSLLGVVLIAGLLVSLTGTNAFAIQKIGSPDLGFGPIVSINKNWILFGHWVGYINQTNPKDSGFYSMFQMIMTNGSAPHMHKIYNATANEITKQGNNTIIKGTVSITMKEGPVNNVPTTITIGNNNTIAIAMDPAKLNNHFGNTPIFGVINNYKQDLKMAKMIVNDPEVMKKWVPLIGKGLVLGGMHGLMHGGMYGVMHGLMFGKNASMMGPGMFGPGMMHGLMFGKNASMMGPGMMYGLR